jgi:hypothetical protein
VCCIGVLPPPPFSFLLLIQRCAALLRIPEKKLDGIVLTIQVDNFK